MSGAFITLDGVTKTYSRRDDTVLALERVDLQAALGEFICLLGVSGCGKSTLLKIMNRMYDLYPRQHAEGAVMLDGANILDKGQDLNLLSRPGPPASGSLRGCRRGPTWRST